MSFMYMRAMAAGLVDQYESHAPVRLRVQSVPEGESKTDESHAESCCLNRMMANYQRTGFLPPDRKVPFYEDVSMLNRDLGELLVNGNRAMENLVKAGVFKNVQNVPPAPSVTDSQNAQKSDPVKG